MNWDDFTADAATDTGMRRNNNQDGHALVRALTPEAWRARGHLFMVADGMGAHAVGELASKLACDNIPHNYRKSKSGTPVEAITKAYREVAAIIHGKASANRDFQGMGTTCSTLLLLPAGALIAHVGDSRVYRARDGRMDQLSFDHSLMWELIRRKHLTSDHDLRDVPRNVITRSLGPDPTVEVDIEGPMPVEPGDAFLICSDGLSGPVTDPELGAFAGAFGPGDACRYLLNLANLRGGLDNITVLIVRIGPWSDPDAPAESAQAAPAAEANGHSKGRAIGQALVGLFAKKGAKVEPEAPREPYRSCLAPIDNALMHGCDEAIRKAQAQAVEQSWSLDWTALAVHRRRAIELQAAGEPRLALRMLGEAIVMLGLAGRLHKKQGSAPSSR